MESCMLAGAVRITEFFVLKKAKQARRVAERGGEGGENDFAK